jgi:hypothetical protein
MLRYLTPYLIVGAALTIAAGVAYGVGAIGVPATYALLFAGAMVAGVGYMRWDERQHPHRDH